MSKYFPNNWKDWKELPEDHLPCPTFEEFMDWKVGGWELPSSVHCIIRTEHRESGTVAEFIYSKPKNAATKLKNLFEQNEHDITLVDRESVQIFTSKE
ncbi:MAG: hypothetical protein CL779_02595 [Chloroflexi bacterium]|nr:hypothetical protein [Chloroflexota bacterium]